MDEAIASIERLTDAEKLFMTQLSKKLVNASLAGAIITGTLTCAVLRRKGVNFGVNVLVTSLGCSVGFGAGGTVMLSVHREELQKIMPRLEKLQDAIKSKDMREQERIVKAFMGEKQGGEIPAHLDSQQMQEAGLTDAEISQAIGSSMTNLPMDRAFGGGDRNFIPPPMGGFKNDNSQFAPPPPQSGEPEFAPPPNGGEMFKE